MAVHCYGIGLHHCGRFNPAATHTYGYTANDGGNTFGDAIFTYWQTLDTKDGWRMAAS